MGRTIVFLFMTKRKLQGVKKGIGLNLKGHFRGGKREGTSSWRLLLRALGPLSFFERTGIMGSVCCCLNVDDFEDYVNPNSSIYRNCMCLSCFIQNFINVYTSLFRRGEAHSVPSSIQGAASITSSASLDNSLADMYRSPPRPLPYDADPRYFRLQRDGLISRRDKGSSHSHEEAEPLRSDTDADSESLSTADKWSESVCEDGSKEHRSKSSNSLKLSVTKPTTGVGNIYTSSEEEDVCPTCLEGICLTSKLSHLVITN
ncbi:hypothetical protein F8388_010088 [Cannabis sativa]|uniref:RING-type E3 ubiquitin transferase n=1 Tax=Cannabis sativa TaxID=3483 RepID=A0A7J6GRI8_CANSA|nr:hypothetical protein F8388_010088 [Cannabis sativa]